MKFNLRENYSELLRAAVNVLRKVENGAVINLTDKDVKFLMLELKDNDVNDDVMHIINANYYGRSESRGYVGDIIRVIRKEPKPAEKCEPNRHIRIQPFFEC